MDKPLLAREINNIIGTKLKNIRRVLNILMVTFESTGGIEYHFHIQCGWRITIDNILITGYEDVYIPQEEIKDDFVWNDFEWDNSNETLLDKRLITVKNKVITSDFLAEKVTVNDYGDITILAKTEHSEFLFEAISCASISEIESWSMLVSDKHADYHFVMNGGGNYSFE